MFEGECGNSNLILHALLICDLVIASAPTCLSVLIVVYVAFSNLVAFVFHTWYNKLLFNFSYTYDNI